MTKWMTKEEYKINFLYAFPSYRCLLRELDSRERVIRKLEKNIEGYKRRIEYYDSVIKQKNRIIFRLRKKRSVKDEKLARLQNISIK